MTTMTLQELRTVGIDGLVVRSIFPGTNPNATEEDIAAEIERSLRAFIAGEDIEEIVEFDD